MRTMPTSLAHSVPFSRLSGTVAAGARPVSGATVIISSPRWAAMTTTDLKGRYQFSRLPPGSYLVAAGKEGYRLTSVANVSISESASALDLVLEDDDEGEDDDEVAGYF